MSKPDLSKGVDISDLETAEKLVGTTGDPKAEIALRAQLSMWPKQMAVFFNEELNRANPIDVMYVMNMLFLQTYASFAAQLFGPDADKMVLELAIQSYKDRLIPHMKAVRSSTANGGKPDRASRPMARPAGAPAAREAKR